MIKNEGNVVIKRFTGKMETKPGFTFSYSGCVRLSDNKLHGPGIFEWINEKGETDMIYVGMFENQMKHGKGMLDSKSLNERYFGEFKGDKFHGKGWLKYSDGSRFIGEFMDG